MTTISRITLLIRSSWSVSPTIYCVLGSTSDPLIRLCKYYVSYGLNWLLLSNYTTNDFYRLLEVWVLTGMPFLLVNGSWYLRL